MRTNLDLSGHLRHRLLKLSGKIQLLVWMPAHMEPSVLISKFIKVLWSIRELVDDQSHF